MQSKRSTALCEQCKKPISYYICQPRKYCNRACWNAHKDKSFDIPCAYCGKIVRKFAYRTRESAPRFCDRQCSGKAKSRDLQERFFEKVQKSEGCWLWIAGLDTSGYGTFREASDQRAHRVSWRIHRGPIPSGIEVLHKCDNPPCVNPDHLFLGTQTDNIADMVKKGRNKFSIGSNHANSKLTESIVEEIKKRLLAGDRLREIGTDCNVTFALIGHIKAGRSWNHVPWPC